MTAMIALIKRELLEHRVAFVIAPAVLVALLFISLALGMTFGETEFSDIGEDMHAPKFLFTAALGVIFVAWTAYLLIALFFYYADAFSADRRNNSLLFWKSMPQSDFKVLASKALGGITIFPALVVGFALITSFLAYLLSFLVSAQLPITITPSLTNFLSSFVQMGIVGTLFMMLTVLWYAPFLAWVAGLSTVVQRWSIPLAFLVPATVIFVESMITFGQPASSRPIAGFLSRRVEGLLDNSQSFEDFSPALLSNPLGLVPELFASINWLEMITGWIFTVIVIYLASEYRRRRIDA